MVTYDKQRKRVWIVGARIHHGAVGVVLLALGAWLTFDDRHDFPWTHDNA